MNQSVTFSLPRFFLCSASPLSNFPASQLYSFLRLSMSHVSHLTSYVSRLSRTSRFSRLSSNYAIKSFSCLASIGTLSANNQFLFHFKQFYDKSNILICSFDTVIYIFMLNIEGENFSFILVVTAHK